MHVARTQVRPEQLVGVGRAGLLPVHPFDGIALDIEELSQGFRKRWIRSPSVADDMPCGYTVFLHSEGTTMKVVNVRQLKNNPSAALRAAREHPVIILKRDHPEAVLVHLDEDSLLEEPGVRRALATSLYREESLSLGQAARFSGLAVAQFIAHVSRLGIPIVRGTPGSVREDGETIAQWRKRSSSPTPAR